MASPRDRWALSPTTPDTTVLPGAYQTYQASLDPTTWTRLNRVGDGGLDLNGVVGIGLRATNQAEGSISRAITDVAMDNMRIVRAPEGGPVTVLLQEDFESTTPDGYAAWEIPRSTASPPC